MTAKEPYCEPTAVLLLRARARARRGVRHMDNMLLATKHVLTTEIKYIEPGWNDKVYSATIWTGRLQETDAVTFKTADLAPFINIYGE